MGGTRRGTVTGPGLASSRPPHTLTHRHSQVVRQPTPDAHTHALSKQLSKRGLADAKQQGRRTPGT
jgi:hypothetical protein